MRFVLFEPDHGLPQAAIPLFSALLQGCNPIRRPLSQLSLPLEPGETAVLSTLYERWQNASFAPFLASHQPFVVVDHTWFHEVGRKGPLRGTYFRVVANAFQPRVLPKFEAGDASRAKTLGLAPVVGWHPCPALEDTRVLQLFPSPEYLAHFPRDKKQFALWCKSIPHEIAPHHLTMRKRNVRYRQTVEEVLARHHVVVGYNNGPLLRALRLGVPAVGFAGASVVHSFNGLDPSHILPSEKGTDYLRQKSVEELEQFCAVLASRYQASLAELARPGFLHGLVEGQLAFSGSQAQAAA